MRTDPVDRTRALDRETLWATVGRPRIVVLVALSVLDAWLVFAAFAPSDRAPAPGVTGALWQVEAAILGLAVAVALFGLQVGREALHGRSISLAPRLEAAIYLGLGLLIITGLVSLFPLSQQRQSWGAVPLLAAFVGWLLVVAAGFAEARRLTDAREHVRLRSGRLLRASNLAANRLLEARVGAHLLEPMLGRIGVELSPWLEPANLGVGTDVEYARAGVVSDVRMCQFLGTLTRLAATPPPPSVNLTLWRQVSASARLARVPAGVAPQVGQSLRTSVRIATETNSVSVVDELDLLAGYGADAVMDAGLVNAVLDAYAVALGSYANAWTPYVGAFTAEHLPTGLMGEISPVDAMSRNLVRMARAALRADADDSAAALMFFPVRILRDTTGWHAPGYLRLLNLEATFVYVAQQVEAPDRARAATRERAWRYLTEGLAFFVRGFMIRRGLEPEQIDSAERAVSDALLEVLRALLVVGDLENFREGLRMWRIRDHESRIAL